MDHWGSKRYSGPPARTGKDGRWNDVDNRSVKIDLDGTYGTNGYQGEWLHITVSWEKNTPTTCELNLYLNGELGDTGVRQRVAGAGATSFTLPAGTKATRRRPATRAGIGVFDELAIWSRKLSDCRDHGCLHQRHVGPAASGRRPQRRRFRQQYRPGHRSRSLGNDCKLPVASRVGTPAVTVSLTPTTWTLSARTGAPARRPAVPEPGDVRPARRARASSPS